MFVPLDEIIMRTLLVFIVVLQGLCSAEAGIDIEPGQCFSRYDYDYKVVRQLVDLEMRLEKLQQEVKNQKERQSVAFMAELSTSIVNPPTGTTIKFDTVVTNIGGNYDPESGLFVAEVAGTYNFHLFAASPKKSVGNWLHLYIMRNTEQVGYVWLDDNNDRWSGRSTSVVVHLHPGDRVYVKVGQLRNTATLAGCCFHTHFNGFLLEQDN